MASKTEQVKKQTLYIGVAVAFVVGFLGGIVFSSVQSDNYTAPSAQQRQAPPGMGGQPGAQSQGLSPQQASTILALEQNVAADPGDVASWVKLGNIYFDSNRFAKAIRAYEKSLELRPGDANVLTDLGVMYRRNGEQQMAIGAFDRAIKADPRHEQARFNKGVVLMYDMGDIAGAVQAWEEILAINPGATSSNGVPLAQVIADAKKQL